MLLKIYLFLYFVLLVLFVGDHSIRDFDEAVYLNASKIMRTSGSYLVPEYYWGEPRTNKPIGLYWAILTGQFIFGENLPGARIISITGAFFTLIFTYKIANLLFPDKKKNEMVVVVLSATPFFFHMTWLIKPEMVLVTFITIAHYYLLRILKSDERNNKDIIAFYAAMAFGFMIKGPPAVIFPLLTAIIYRVVVNKPDWSFVMLSIRGWSVFLIIVLPWYLYLLNQFGLEYFMETFNREIVQRITYNNQSYSQGLSLITFSPWIWVILSRLKLRSPRQQFMAADRNTLYPILWFSSSFLFIVLFVREYHNHYSLDYIVPASLLANGVLNKGNYKKLFISIFFLTSSVYFLAFYFSPISLIDPAFFLIGFGLLVLSVLAIYFSGNNEMTVWLTASLVMVNLWYNYLWIQPNLDISPMTKFIANIESDAGDIAVSNRLINIDFSFFWWQLGGQAGSSYYSNKEEFSGKIKTPSKNLKYAICSEQTFNDSKDLITENWFVLNKSFFYQGDYQEEKGVFEKIKDFLLTGDINEVLHEYVLLKVK